MMGQAGERIDSGLMPTRQGGSVMNGRTAKTIRRKVTETSRPTGPGGSTHTLKTATA